MQWDDSRGGGREQGLQQVRELDDAYEITTIAVDTAVLDWWLRGFGDAVQAVTKKGSGYEK